MSEQARPPKKAASVILIRPTDSGEAEIFLLCRHRKASFMASSYVFPGGVEDQGESDPRITAARELFEEAGVLITKRPSDSAQRAQWRARVLGGEAFSDLLAAEGHELDLEAMTYFAHWITPSIEAKRYSAQFFVAQLPAGQTPSFDNLETVDEVWVTPREAIDRAAELKLPPPQLRSMFEMRDAAKAGVAAVVDLARERATTPHAFLPRACPLEHGFALLMPWDPDYETRGTGDAAPMPPGHKLAHGPSRVIFEDGWRHVHAPDSTKTASS